MFDRLRIRGGSAAILVGGYRTAAALTGWTIAREARRVGGSGVWILTATVGRADPFFLRQAGLVLAAPRQGGFFYFPVLEAPTIADRVLRARLGPPEN